MPKLVDHTQKRMEIIRATWRLVAARGFEAATMREIAAESGHANGGLSHYFGSKDELLQAAYLFVWEETNARIARRLGTATGLAAIRIYWEEIFPGTDTTQLEARIAMPFFARGGTDPALAQITAETVNQWRRELGGHLDQARADGEITVDTPTDLLVEHLIGMLMGLQALGVLSIGENELRRYRSMLAAYLALLTR